MPACVEVVITINDGPGRVGRGAGVFGDFVLIIGMYPVANRLTY